MVKIDHFSNRSHFSRGAYSCTGHNWVRLLSKNVINDSAPRSNLFWNACHCQVPTLLKITVHPLILCPYRRSGTFS